MTPEKRLALLAAAAIRMESKIREAPVSRHELLHFTECVRLVAVQSDDFLAHEINRQQLADGLGLPLSAFTEPN